MAAWTKTHRDNFMRAVSAPKSREHREKIRRGVKASYTPRLRRIRSEDNRRNWKDPEYRERIIFNSKKARRSKSHRRRMRAIARQRWRNGERGWADHKKTTFGPSLTQRILRRRLLKAGIKHLRLEYQVKRYRIDIADLKTKTAIESDGKPWHRKNSRRDREGRGS